MTGEVDLTHDLLALGTMVTGHAALDEILSKALVALGSVIEYELAAVLRLDGDRLWVQQAVGALASPRVRQHSLSLAKFPTVQAALRARYPVALSAEHHASDEGDPYDGVLDLPDGHACMVVPLFVGDRALGVITLDGRVCGQYSPTAVRLAGVYGQLVSMALWLAEQAQVLDRSRTQWIEQTRLLTQELGGADVACARLEASESEGMREVARLARQVAASSLPVLILGETGTGKEVVAQAIHTWSDRRNGPFVKVNCSAIPEGLFESELFGHVRGAFSGADRDRRGRFLTANGGTLLLDEIGDMPLAAQAKLLRVLQEGTFEALGSDRSTRVDVRVLAATHVDLEAAIAARRFRQDLYYRLAVFPLRLLPLRERVEEVVPLAMRHLAALHRRTRRGPWSLAPKTRARIESAPWPGNIRELVHALERATLLVPEGELLPQHLGLGPLSGRAAPRPQDPLPDFEANERRYFEAVLARAEGRLYGPGSASEITGLKPTTLRSRLVKLGLR
ncbi:MAG: sigma 54-interacting transcriptional regulator [Myxococcales bacterium]|nr:sigma 54-interacting transcriptional regulator [Myxococcales bacterium]